MQWRHEGVQRIGMAGACLLSLMGNHYHYHVVLETPNANLVAGMAWLQSTYTIRLNHRHKLFGHVFSGRYKALVVDGSGHGYLKTACDYVHLNPARAKLLTAEQPLSESGGAVIRPFRLTAGTPCQNENG